MSILCDQSYLAAGVTGTMSTAFPSNHLFPVRNSLMLLKARRLGGVIPSIRRTSCAALISSDGSLAPGFRVWGVLGGRRRAHGLILDRVVNSHVEFISETHLVRVDESM